RPPYIPLYTSLPACVFLFSSYVHTRYLHSFPTRRSSDLWNLIKRSNSTIIGRQAIIHINRFVGTFIFSLLNYLCITVPVSPAIPAAALSRSVISVRLPSFDSAKRIAASIFGSIEPLANWS